MSERGGGFPFVPTDEQRAVVSALAGTGHSHKLICTFVVDPIEQRPIDPKTLRKHFRTELNEGKERANAQVRATLFKMATNGRNTVATLFWCKTQMGYKEARDAPLLDASYGELVAAAAAEAAKLIEAKKNAPPLKLVEGGKGT